MSEHIRKTNLMRLPFLCSLCSFAATSLNLRVTRMLLFLNHIKISAGMANKADFTKRNK